MTSGCALTHGPCVATSRNSGSSAARVLPWCIRIDPDEDAVPREQQLVANRVGEGFDVNGWPCLDAGSGERLEDADEAAVLRGRVPTGGSVSAREDSDSMMEREVPVGVQARFSTTDRVSRRAWTEKSDGESACPHGNDSTRLRPHVSRRRLLPADAVRRVAAGDHRSFPRIDGFSIQALAILSGGRSMDGLSWTVFAWAAFAGGFVSGFSGFAMGLVSDDADGGRKADGYGRPNLARLAQVVR